MTRVIADIQPHAPRSRHVISAYTIQAARIRCQEAADELGCPLTVTLWRWPDVSGDPFGLDVPTWRTIRTPDQLVRTDEYRPRR